jgi:ABC-type nitrate/sulfonate/bicarbonate transport system substrate-binding protein
MSTLVVREIVARSGLGPDRDVTYLSVGGSDTRSGAMSAGFVDAALMTIPLNYAPERQGYNRLASGPDYVRYPMKESPRRQTISPPTAIWYWPFCAGWPGECET